MVIEQQDIETKQVAGLSQNILGLHDKTWHKWWKHITTYRGDMWCEYQQQALVRLNKKGFPAYRKGSWCYTNIAKCYNKKTYAPLTKHGDCQLPDIEKYMLQDCIHLVVVDGCFSRPLSSIKGFKRLFKARVLHSTRRRVHLATCMWNTI